MRILVTSPNDTENPGGVLDFETGTFDPFRWPKELSPVARGATRQGASVCIAVEEPQHGSCLYFLGWNGHELSMPEGHNIPGVRDIHSIVWWRGQISIVSSGNDNLCAYDLTHRSVGLIAGSPDHTEDTRHINSLARWRGEWWVSSFGPKPSEGWRPAVDGAVWPVNTKTVSVIGKGKAVRANTIPLVHPHSLFVLDDRLMVLESGTGMIREAVTCAVACELPGYVRGVAVDDAAGCLYVGISDFRELSKHTGQSMVCDSVGGVPDHFRCGIFQVDLDTWTVKAYRALPQLKEVFELLLLG